MGLAAIIRQAKITTSVTAGATCASACFVAFAAGTEKYAHYSATVGVHGASDKSGRETATSSTATVMMGRIVKELGVPSAIIGKMVITPPSEMVWLSPADLRSMGATMTGKPDQIAPPQVVTPQVPSQDEAPVRAKGGPEPSWGDLVKGAAALSSRQNGGKPDFRRSCQPELKICNNALFFVHDKTEMMAKTVEDMSGKVIRRELCGFNKHGDIRYCRNYDTREMRTDMKDNKGDWHKVGDD